MTRNPSDIPSDYFALGSWSVAHLKRHTVEPMV